MFKADAVFFTLFMTLFSANAEVLTFDSPLLGSGVQSYNTAYYEQGMKMDVVVGPPYFPYDMLTRSSSHTTSTAPTNGTPYMTWKNGYAIDQFIKINLTNGLSFGLTAVDLADRSAPSPAPITIVFNGHKTDGSVVSASFSTPGGGATTFKTFNFGSDFSSDLAWVEIPSTVWAMDNLIFTPVPEPGVAVFGGLAILGGILWRSGQRKQ